MTPHRGTAPEAGTGGQGEGEAPFRVCCGQQHHGPVCPDGLVMCPICFRRNPRERLHVLEQGDGTDVTNAPIYSDVCRTCHEREQRWGTRLTPPASGASA